MIAPGGAFLTGMAADASVAAGVVFPSIFGESPVGLRDHEGLPDDVAAELRAIAAGG